MSHVGLTGMHGACRYASPQGGVERAVVALPVPTSSEVLPDLTDPCTLGGLLALVTAAYRWEMLPYMDSKGDWGVRRAIPGYGPIIPSTHRTKAAALVAALEAAP